ncbi:MAG TPA: amidohydrolase family protein [Candidatus Binataceae bacterium]|nr:amidohydrolase family protein [Candidatus Binataceae bacterium]
MLPFKLVSADSHVLEPPDMWLKRIDRRYLERAPRIVHEADADYFVCASSETPKVGIGTSSSAEKKPEEISMAERWENVLPGGYDPFARVKDMERDGVEAEILYTTFGLFLFAIDDLDLQFACFQAFNDWVANYCASSPGRLFGVAMIPTEPAERATAEMERCMRAGLKAAMISVSQDHGKGYDHPMYDRIWSASEDLRMPISLHLAGSRRSFARTGNVLADFALGFTPAMYSVALMVFSGVFDRHRRLKVVTVENDAGWAAMMLERMDFRYERDRFWAGPANGISSGRLPSRQFHEHVYCTFMRDHTAVRNRAYIGLENLMWGSDYPHQDSSFPNSIRIVGEHFADVPVSDQCKIARSNAISLYNLPLQP